MCMIPKKSSYKNGSIKIHFVKQRLHHKVYYLPCKKLKDYESFGAMSILTLKGGHSDLGTELLQKKKNP